jgi:hypothetical protein
MSRVISDSLIQEGPNCTNKQTIAVAASAEAEAAVAAERAANIAVVAQAAAAKVGAEAAAVIATKEVAERD